MKSTAFILLVALSLSALAHEGHEAKKGSELVGEVIDLTCYLDHDSKGDKHASCAEKCIAKGNPVAILVGDKLYMVIKSDHESPNVALAPFAGKKVRIKGTVLEKNGMHAIDLESVQPVAK
jgi:hypothetical protein